MASPTARVFQALWKDQDLQGHVLADLIERVVGKRASRQEIEHWLKGMVNGLCRAFPRWVPDLDADQVDWRRLTEFFCACFYAWRARQPPPGDPPDAYWMGEDPEAGEAVLHPQRARAIFETVPVPMLPLEEKLLELGGRCVVYIGEPDLEALLARGRAFGGAARLILGQPCQCHMNAADLWEAHRGKLAIVTGYALSRDGLWRQHSWLLRTHPTAHQRSIIETTARRERYYGFVLDEREADAFCRANGAGSGCYEFLDL